MKYKNAFFRLEIRDDGTYLDVYPPQDGGRPLDHQEVIDYIERHGVLGFSAEKLKLALEAHSDTAARIRLTEEKIEPVHEEARVFPAKDMLSAFVRFYPPSNGGSLMTKREIIGEFERIKITYGISEKMIDMFIAHRQYCTNIVMVKGLAPVRATDTIIEYFFDPKPLAKPKLNEDGSVDFHEMQLFTTVHKGDVLAKLTPHTLGEAGISIYGKKIPQNRPKVKPLKFGKNITQSEDQTTLTSDVDGNVTLVQGTVFVSSAYVVPANVDASTGDIEYDGNVQIKGTVKTGFTVKAKGDIEVDGVVEGATLEAGGNVIIKRGVQGMNKGFIKAGGDVCAQFFESAKVEAGGDVTAGSILHSNVISGDKIIVRGKKGFIVGGVCMCSQYVEACTIGNKMVTRTEIKVGVKPELHEELKHLIPKVNEINDKYAETESYLRVYKEKIKKGKELGGEDLKKVKVYNATLDELEEDREKLNERLREIKTELEKGSKGSVKVAGSTFMGVSIFISKYSYMVKKGDTHSWYKVLDGSIKQTGF